jgi:hypothetical protein
MSSIFVSILSVDLTLDYFLFWDILSLSTTLICFSTNLASSRPSLREELENIPYVSEMSDIKESLGFFLEVLNSSF